MARAPPSHFLWAAVSAARLVLFRAMTGKTVVAFFNTGGRTTVGNVQIASTQCSTQWKI
jgi:hypothetical protein